MELESVKGLGPKTVKLLNKININNTNDLVNYFPFRYQIYQIIDINKATEEEITVTGTINSLVKVNYIKRNLNRLSFQCIINNLLVNVIIFNRAFLKTNLSINKKINLIGKYNKKTNTFIANNIIFDEINGFKIEPVYHLVSGLHNKQLIKAINNVLSIEKEKDYIPNYLVDRYHFINKDTSLKYIHAPKSVEEIKQAKLRLIYEELFLFMFKINYFKHKNVSSSKLKRIINEEEINNYINNLPFQLTGDQNKAVLDIINDFKSKKRMNRLLLGDVGSGKTVVAVISLFINYLNGYQGALMAPTEILSSQHFFTLQMLLKDTNMRIELLTRTTPKKEKERIIEDLKNNKIDLIIGTHAILNENVIFNNLGLVITDEQHRFGVNQRSNLQNKGIKPDVIYLSATPIPRTYALTLYGDMDISLIKDKPKGRKEIITYLKKDNEIKDVLYMMDDEIKKGHQIYVVAPLIDENEELNLNDVKALKEKLHTAFKDRANIEILHGKLKDKEKDNIMHNFINNNINILISTTVIEVGIDVSNATMMVIFNAERFGLASLHQLRGRVGRSELESKCVLISNYESKRLQVLVESNDGFYISEQDFLLRGEGDLLGTKQSGDMTFRIANLKRDFKILLQTKEDVVEFIKNNDQNNYYNYPLFKNIEDNISSVS